MVLIYENIWKRLTVRRRHISEDGNLSKFEKKLINFGLKYILNEEWRKLRDMQLYSKLQTYLDIE
jgi:hypothetical protein